MYRLKDDYTSREAQNSNEYIQDKLTYAGINPNTKLIKVRYVKLEEVSQGRKNKIQMKQLELERLEIPEGLSLADSLKTYSYVLDQIARKTGAEKNSLLCSQIAYHCLQQYHFTEVSSTERKKEKCLTLYVVDGQPKLLPETSIYRDYVDWYVPNITREEISNAYREISLSIPRFTKINFEAEQQPGEEE